MPRGSSIFMADTCFGSYEDQNISLNHRIFRLRAMIQLQLAEASRVLARQLWASHLLWRSRKTNALSCANEGEMEPFSRTSYIDLQTNKQTYRTSALCCYRKERGPKKKLRLIDQYLDGRIFLMRSIFP